MTLPMRTLAGTVSVNGAISTGGGHIGQTISAGATATARHRTLPYEQSKTTHQLLSAANCGSLEKSTAMIEEIRRDLDEGDSAFFLPLVDRMIGEMSDEEAGDPGLSLDYLKGRLHALTRDYQEFVGLQGKYRATGRPEILEAINEAVFDGYYDCAKRRQGNKQIDFEMDFLSRAVDSYSFALGVIGNRISEATLRASEEAGARVESDPADAQIDVLENSSAGAHEAYSKAAKMIESSFTGVPMGTRLRHGVLQAIGESVTTEYIGSANVHVKLFNPKSEVKPVDPAQIAAIGTGSARVDISLNRSKVVGHANPTRQGTFITLTIDVDAGFPFSVYQNVLVDEALRKLATDCENAESHAETKAADAAQKQANPGRTSGLTKALKKGLEEALQSRDVLSIVPHLVGGVLRNRITVKVRRPPADEGFKGKWAQQYVRVDQAKTVQLKLNSPNALQGTPGGVLTAGLNSTQLASRPIFERFGEDLGYQVLQFKHGGAFDTKTQTPDLKKLKSFYESAAGRLTKQKLFEEPKTVLRMVSSYATYLKTLNSPDATPDATSRGALTEFHRFDLPGHSKALRLGREASRINPGNAAPLLARDEARRFIPVDPLDLDIPDMPGQRELEALEAELAECKTEDDAMEKYFSSVSGEKTMAAYMRIVGRYDAYKVMVRNAEGYTLVARPFGGKPKQYAKKPSTRATKTAEDRLTRF